MNPILRNILAVIAGAFLGGLVNFGIIMLSPSVIPLPAGVDPTSVESLKTNMHLFETKHFIMPFLAHALGTLVGAFIAAKLAGTHTMRAALIVGVVFMIGGIMNVASLPAPMWFNITDIALAYIPMGWLGGTLARGKSVSENA
jgi:hypothetical protein